MNKNGWLISFGRIFLLVILLLVIFQVFFSAAAEISLTLFVEGRGEKVFSRTLLPEVLKPQNNIFLSHFDKNLEEKFDEDNAIKIISAEKLDKNRNFVEDVFWKVNSLDRVFEKVGGEEYVRVRFEKKLSKYHDITIYAKSKDSASVEVYEKDGEEKIADFGEISEGKNYRILLGGLSKHQDTFDLKVVGGNVFFDKIIDPTLDYNTLINSLNPEARWPLEANGTDYTGNGHNTNGGTGPAGGFVPTIIPRAPFANASDWNGDTYDFPDSPRFNTGAGYLGTERGYSVWFVADTIDASGAGRGIWTEGGGTNSLSIYTFNNGTADNIYCTAVEGANIDFVFYPINEGDLYHLGCMFDFAGGRIDMYLNGSLVASDVALAVGGSLSSHGNDNAIGGVDQNTDNHLGNQLSGFFDGRIADLVYWSDGNLITAKNFSDIYKAGADMLPPNIFIESPLNQTYGVSSLDFNVSLDDDGSWCAYSLNDTANVTMDQFNDTAFNYTYAGFSDSYYNITFSCNDSVGNMNSSQYTYFTIDTTNPFLTLVEPQNTSYNTDNLWINFSVYDLTLDSCWYTNNSGINNYTLASCQNTTYLAIQGSTTIIVYANDSLGRLNSSNASFFVDSVNPLIDYSTGVENDGRVITGESVFVNVSVTEINEQNISFYLYNSTFGVERENTYTDGTRSITWNLLPEGIFYYNVTVYDSLGNFNSTATRNITLDNTAPVVDYTLGTNENYANISWNFIYVNISVTEDNEANVSFSLYFSNETFFNETLSVAGTRSVNWTNLIDEDYIYNVTVFDLAGQSTSTASRNLRVDTTNPLIDFDVGTESDNANFSRNWVYVNVSVNEAYEKNLTFELYFNNGTLLNSSTYPVGAREINWTNVPNGIFRYNVTAFDFSSNSNSTATRKIGLDTKGPTINILEPQAKAYGYNVSLPLNYTVVDNLIGVDSCWWNLDSGANNTLTCGTNTTFDTSNGAHTLYFYSNDSFGNLGSSQVTFSVSTEGPAIVKYNPENDTFYPSDPSEIFFNYTAEDPDGVVSCSLYGTWNGGWHLNQTKFGIESGNFSNFTLNVSGEGTYLWNVECNDTLGFYEFTISNFTFGIDTTNSLIDYSSGTEVNKANLSQSFVFVNVSVNETNEKNISFYLYNATSLLSSAFYSAGRRNHTFSGLIDGTYFYNVTVFDKAGNFNSTLTREILLDTGGLSVNLTSPENGSYQSNASQNFTADFSDDNSLANVTLFIFNSTGHLIYQTTQFLTDVSLATIGLVYTFAYDGVFQWFYRVFDFVGNVQDSENNTVIIDTTLPLIDYIAGTEDNDTIFERDWVNINVSVTEINEANITFKLYKSDGTLDFTNTYTDFRREVNITNRLNDIYRYNVTVYDLAGNVNTSQARTITLDSAFPQVSYGVGVASNDSNVSQTWIYVNLSVFELSEINVTFYLYNGSGLLNNVTFTNLTHEFNFTGLIDGTYFYNATIFDYFNRSNSTETRTLNLDPTHPLISYSSGTENNATSFERNWIYVNVSVTEVNEKNISFYLYNSSGLVSQVNFTNLTHEYNFTNILGSNVSYSYNVTVFDYSGNKNSTITRMIDLIDLTGPVISIIEPKAKTYGSNVSMALNVSVSDFLSDTDSCWWNLDSGANNTLACGTNTTFNTTEAVHTLYFYSNDTLGNWNVESVTFSISLLGPAITLVSPIDNYNFSGFQDIYFNYTVEDPDGIETCSLYGNWNLGWHLNQSKYDWLDSLWTYRKEINLTNGGGTVLTNFPVFLNISKEAGMQTDYDDLRIYNGTCSELQSTPLDYEIEDYDSISANLWLRIQSLEIGVNSLCLYYGNSAAANGENVAGVWDATFESIYHLEDSASGTGVDLIGTYDMTEVGTLTNVDGVSGNATNFDGGTDELNDPNGWRDTTATPTTWEAWVKTTSGTIDMIIMEDGGATHGFALGMDSGVLGIYTAGQGGTQVLSTTSGYNDGIWHYVVGIHNSTTNLLYIDGNLNNTAAGDPGESGTGNAGIGGASGSIVGTLSNNFNGDIDEVRFSDGQRSDDWINQTYQFVANQGSLVNFGPGVHYDNLSYFVQNISEEGYFDWNIECNDTNGFVSSAGLNFTFSVFLPADKVENESIAISQSNNSGDGDVLISWNTSNHTASYKIYYTNDLALPFTLLNTTSLTNYTDYGPIGDRRRFYKISSWNPISENTSEIILGRTIYYLKRVGGVGTRNWIGFYLNDSKILDANDTLNEINNITTFNLWNATIQRRVTCNLFSCPNAPSCTETNCNFGIEDGRGYEVNLNSSAPVWVNWSRVGLVVNPLDINLTKNVSSFGKNWVSMYANTTLNNGQEFLPNVTNADAVSAWNESNQTSVGVIYNPFPWIPGNFLGNFSIEIEEGYEISVNTSGQWTQI